MQPTGSPRMKAWHGWKPLLWRSIPWILFALVAGAWAWQAWSPDLIPLRERIVTTGDAESLRVQVENDTSFTDEEKEAFANAVGLVNGVQPYGKTVARLVDDELSKENANRALATQAANAAETVKSELAGDVQLKAIGLKVQRNQLPGVTFQDPYDDIDQIDLLAVNRGHKTIRSFIATATLTKNNGEDIYEGDVSADTIL